MLRLMVKHLFTQLVICHPAGHRQGKVESAARQGGERSGPCRDVRVTELCEVKGDVTIPELKEQLFVAHSPSDVSDGR